MTNGDKSLTEPPPFSSRPSEVDVEAAIPPPDPEEEDILSIAKIPPAVNQVEVNPLWQQKKLIDFCKESGVLVIAYSPLGAMAPVGEGESGVLHIGRLMGVL